MRALWAAGLFALACAGSPSARWRQGGAAIPIESAYWSRPDSTIELRPSGEVIEDEKLLFRIDRAGRVSDAVGEPVAVLAPDGWLMAEDDAPLGFIGWGASFRANRETPSVRVLPSGHALVAVGAEGWRDAGRFTYCEGAMLRTCTLVAHVVAARDAAQRPRGDGSGSSNAGDVLKLLELLRLAR